MPSPVNTFHFSLPVSGSYTNVQENLPRRLFQPIEQVDQARDTRISELSAKLQQANSAQAASVRPSANKANTTENIIDSIENIALRVPRTQILHKSQIAPDYTGPVAILILGNHISTPVKNKNELILETLCGDTKLGIEEVLVETDKLKTGFNTTEQTEQKVQTKLAAQGKTITVSPIDNIALQAEYWISQYIAQSIFEILCRAQEGVGACTPEVSQAVTHMKNKAITELFQILKTGKELNLEAETKELILKLGARLADDTKVNSNIGNTTLTYNGTRTRDADFSSLRVTVPSPDYYGTSLVKPVKLNYGHTYHPTTETQEVIDRNNERFAFIDFARDQHLSEQIKSRSPGVYPLVVGHIHAENLTRLLEAQGTPVVVIAGEELKNSFRMYRSVQSKYFEQKNKIWEAVKA